MSMDDPKPRKEEARIDGEEIVGKVKETFEGGIHTEEIKVQGDQLLAKVKELVRAGNVRRIILKNSEGVRILEIPLTLGVVGAVVLPVWAAIGAVAALAVDYTIVVEKVEQE
jgi:hypothetical protein